MKALTCNSCNKVWNDLIDVRYPLNSEYTKWNIYCNIHIGGCGRTVYGESLEHVTVRWEDGNTDENFSE